MIYFLIECTTNKHDCDSKAMCIDTEESFECECNVGYTGNGKTCSDINECTEGHGCNANASCINTIGSFTCKCKAGYTGNGETCKDIDECADQNQICGDSASCTNNVGSYNCSCNRENYTYNGQTCICDPNGKKIMRRSINIVGSSKDK